MRQARWETGKHGLRAEQWPYHALCFFAGNKERYPHDGICRCCGRMSFFCRAAEKWGDLWKARGFGGRLTGLFWAAKSYVRAAAGLALACRKKKKKKTASGIAEGENGVKWARTIDLHDVNVAL